MALLAVKHPSGPFRASSPAAAMLARLAGCLGLAQVRRSRCGHALARPRPRFHSRSLPPSLRHTPPHLALQDTPPQDSSPPRAAALPPAPPLPPAEPLPLAAGSLAFAVPPSLEAALNVLAAQHPASPKVGRADMPSGPVAETAAACAAGLRRWAGTAARHGVMGGLGCGEPVLLAHAQGCSEMLKTPSNPVQHTSQLSVLALRPLRSYRQRMAPEQRRRERRRLSHEQSDHLKTLQQLGRGLQVPPAPATLPQASRPANGGAAAQQSHPPAQQQPAQQQVPPPFTLAPVFHTGGAEASTQLVPLHRSRPAPQPPKAAGTAQLHSPAERAMAAGTAADPLPPSSAGSVSMQSATSRLAGEDAPASSGSCSAAASAAPLLPHPSLARGSAAGTGSTASLAASTLAQAATSAAASAADHGSTCAAWAAPSPGASGGSAAWDQDLIELELVDADGACVERLPPQPSPQAAFAQAARPARPSPDTEEAVPAQTTPSFLAFAVGVPQAASLVGGSSGSGCSSTAASRPPAHSDAAAGGAGGSPGAAAEHSGSGSYGRAAGLPAVSSQAALLDGPEAHSSGSPGSGGGSQPSSSRAAASAASLGAAAGSAAGSAGALPAVLSSFKRVLHGRLQQRGATRLAATKQAGGLQLAAAGKQQASTRLVAVAAVPAAVGADAEDVLPRRPAAAGRCSADENRPVLP